MNYTEFKKQASINPVHAGMAAGALAGAGIAEAFNSPEASTGKRLLNIAKGAFFGTGISAAALLVAGAFTPRGQYLLSAVGNTIVDPQKAKAQWQAYPGKEIAQQAAEKAIW